MTSPPSLATSCGACGFESPPGLKFCGQCGASLALRCNRCQSPIPAGFKFCGECGEPVAGAPSAAAAERNPRAYTPKHLADKILDSKSALEGERKQVTVLFADVKESMDLAAHLDPEEWHRILERFFEILTEGVHRFEGTVNQYTGDGIMALFGAPVAHEDHAQRACYAALALRDALRAYADELRVSRGVNFGARIGLNSGEVVVGRIGDDLRMDYTAQGHTVGLAQRMEQLAEPGGVLATSHVARLVEGFFALRGLGAMRVKGSSDPLDVYVLEGLGAAKTRLDSARARGLSRFVGRDDEMALLELALDRATKGQGQVVGVVADAGTGKSRLCSEFIGRCRRRGVAVYNAYCPQHGKTLALVPILELFRNYFRIEAADAPLAAREKIAGRLLLLDPSFAETLPLLFEFLGVPDPQRPAPALAPEARQGQLYAFVRRWVRAHSAREPLILAIDDLHWIDDASDRFVAQLVEAAAGTPTLLLMNFRPEYAAEWTRRSWYQQVPLAPLTAAATRQLLDGLLGHSGSLSGLAECIYERTSGNPFFTEEVVQALIESKQLTGSPGNYRLLASVEVIEVPPTVQAVLQARMDRLGSREKRVLQRAAVIGRDFDEPLLAAVAELPAEELRGALKRLVDAEYLVEQSVYPVAEYAFKHPLTQQVAEESQLRDVRQRAHRLVAEALQVLNAKRVEEIAARLAYHWHGAGDALAAARWHRTAAQWIGISDRAEELRHWRSIVAHADALGEREGTELVSEACWKILGLAWRGMAVDASESASLIRLSRACPALLGDDVNLMRALTAHSANYSINKGALGEARVFSEEALELARRSSDSMLELEVRVALDDVNLCSGNLDAAQAGYERTCELSGGDATLLNHGLQAALPVSLCRLSDIQHQRGQHDAARATLQRALDSSEALEKTETPFFCLTLPMPMEILVCGADANTLRRAQRASELSEQAQTPIFRSIEALCAGLLGATLGDPDAAVERLEASSPTVSAVFLPLLWSGVSIAHRRAGRPDEAREAAQRGIAEARRMGTRTYECAAQIALAEALLSGTREDAQAVEAALARTEVLIDATGARGFVPLVVAARSKLAGATGDRVQGG